MRNVKEVKCSIEELTVDKIREFIKDEASFGRELSELVVPSINHSVTKEFKDLLSKEGICSVKVAGPDTYPMLSVPDGYVALVSRIYEIHKQKRLELSQTDAVGLARCAWNCTVQFKKRQLVELPVWEKLTAETHRCLTKVLKEQIDVLATGTMVPFSPQKLALILSNELLKEEAVMRARPTDLRFFEVQMLYKAIARQMVDANTYADADGAYPKLCPEVFPHPL